MSKRFHHLGQEWEAVGTGTGHGVGFGHLPQVNRWGVIFRSISRPEQGDYRYRGTASQCNPEAVSEDELRRILEEPLVIAAIDRSRYTWRPAEAIAPETGLPLERVRQILETTTEADVMRGNEPNPQGYALYTTRDHFVKTTGDVNQRYLVVESSS